MTATTAPKCATIACDRPVVWAVTPANSAGRGATRPMCQACAAQYLFVSQMSGGTVTFEFIRKKKEQHGTR